MRCFGEQYPGKALLYTYIATTRYSKEERASLEIGDAIYPYDPRVEVLIPDIKGVVVVKSCLEPHLIEAVLGVQTLSAVEYISYVAGCSDVVEQSRELAQHLANTIRGYLEAEGLCIGRVRAPRTGALGKEFVNSLLRELRRSPATDCSHILSLEVFGRLVCYGPVIYSSKQVE